eukprot:TRINITY_DN1747_c0_g1_i1.p1 TRINITY_DN1747_c0_g1~~TRINITY_DN1747_c0_g1_i1.p1  ORF type:complete len:255 (+),score=72.24 TRINITY_DN1747_c0_g1_i1:1268-2032(+)
MEYDTVKKAVKKVHDTFRYLNEINMGRYAYENIPTTLSLRNLVLKKRELISANKTSLANLANHKGSGKSLSEHLIYSRDFLQESCQHSPTMEIAISCLNEQLQQIDHHIKELENDNQKLEEEITSLYTNSHQSLSSERYQIHAVFVHDGAAAAGHYWAYISIPNSDEWFKFNDITVSKETSAEVHKESEGGHLKSAAYCVIYVPSSQKNHYSEAEDFEVNTHFKTEVLEDNKRFEKEIESWLNKKQNDNCLHVD